MALAKLPTREVYARFRESGMTRYSYEEIGDALGAHDKAYADFTVVMGEVSDYLAPFRVERPGTIWYYTFDYDGTPDTSPVVKLVRYYNQQCGENYILQSKTSSKEFWPVPTWRKETARCERATNRLRALLAKCGYYTKQEVTA